MSTQERSEGAQSIAAQMERDDVARTSPTDLDLANAQKIFDAAVLASAKVEEARVAALIVLERARAAATAAAAAVATDISGSNIARIRAISGTLKDPDLAYRIIDELPDGILLVDTGSVIQLVNKQTEALFGYTRFELEGSPLDLLIPETSKGTHAEHFKNYIANPVKRPMMPVEKHGLKVIGVRKDGSEISLDVSLTPIHSPVDSYVLAVTRIKEGDDYGGRT